MFIWFMIICDKDRKTCFFDWKFFFDRLWSFNYPESKDFSCIQNIIFISKFFTDCRCLISWISCNNSVDKCRTEYIFFLNPCNKFFSKIPLFCIFQHTFFQFFSVIINKLAGKYDKSFSFLFSKCFKSVIHKLCQFCRIRFSWFVFKFTFCVITDSRFCCITQDKSKFWIFCAFHDFFVVFISIQTSAYTGDDSLVIHFLSILKSTQK